MKTSAAFLLDRTKKILQIHYDNLMKKKHRYWAGVDIVTFLLNKIPC